MSEFGEKLKLVRELFIAGPYLESLMCEIDECKEDSKLGGEAQCMFITGNTGSGKTTLIRKYMENYPRKELADRTNIPVFFTSLPENATPVRASQKMLTDLGDPFSCVSSDLEELRIKLICLLVSCGVELIIIDEFQHLIERKNNKVLHRAADWLKTIIIDSNIPVVLVGMPYSSVILDVNSQLNDRMLFKRRLPPFRVEKESERKVYLQFLKVFDLALPFPDSSSLQTRDVALRLYSHSKGNLRKLRELLNQASRDALLMSANCITSEHFKSAIDKINGNYSDTVNPFDVSHINDVAIDEPDLDIGWEDFKNKPGEILVGKSSRQFTVGDIFATR